MKLGLSSYTYGWAVGAASGAPAQPFREGDLLDEVHAHGLNLLQIGDNLPLEKFDTARLTALRERAARDGVELEVGARRLTPERIDLYAGIARTLGAKLIRFVVDDREFRPDAKEIIRTLRHSLPALEGLRLGLENHDRLKAAELRFIIDAVGSANVGVCLDTANSLGAGEGLETVVAALAPVTLNLHIKDFSVERVPYLMGFNVKGCPAGSGLVNVPQLLTVLQRHRRCSTAVLEQWVPPEDCFEGTIARERDWAAASLTYLKPLFA